MLISKLQTVFKIRYKIQQTEIMPNNGIEIFPNIDQGNV